MSSTVPCANPSRCGVKTHISGSDAHANCNITNLVPGNKASVNGSTYLEPPPIPISTSGSDIEETLEMAYAAEPLLKGKSAKELASWTTENAHRLYDAMKEEGIDEDSWTRESLFSLAAAVNGDDYDVYYDAWPDQKPISKEVSLETIRNSPTEEDYEDARASLRTDLRFKDNKGVKTFREFLPGRRNTEANRARYNEYLDGFIDPDKLEASARFHAKTRAYGRAYEQGIAIDPQLEAEFESMWADDNYNFGEKKTREDLAENKRLLEGLEAGTESPRWIVGRGGTKTTARKYLTNAIAENERSLATRGRSHSVNSRNAEYRLKEKSKGQSF